MPKKPENDDGEMPFLDHLEELRRVIIKCVIALALSCFIIGIFTVQFNELLMYPFERAQQMYGHDVPLPRVGSVFSPFFVMFDIAIFGGIFIALPFILYFLGQFLMPALTEREKKVIRPAMCAATLLFAAGASLAFFFILPTGINFSFKISEIMHWEILYDIQNYYSFVVWVPLATGVSFQLPLLIILFIYIGLLSPKTLRKNRRLVFVLLLIFSAVATPPDPLTMVMLTLPLYLLYEAAVMIGSRLLSGKLEKEEKEEEERRRRDEESYRKYVEEQSKLEDDYYSRSADDGSAPEGGEGGEGGAENSEEESFDYEKYYEYSMNEVNNAASSGDSRPASENAAETSETSSGEKPSEGGSSAEDSGEKTSSEENKPGEKTDKKE
ncbi:MAG: twin-arginine translocase subunit TatC [Opitutales bacterium]|nr:twin-arginine translocase subunit TatC [Opitutales bacterium]